MKKLFTTMMALTLSFPLFAAIDWSRFDQTSDPMPSLGAFRGEVVQHTTRRTLIPLTINEKKELGLDPKAYILANFWHKNNYYLVEIPGVKVSPLGTSIYYGTPIIEKVDFVKEHWAYTSRPETREVEAHSELLFTFKKGCELKLVYDQKEHFKFFKPTRINKAIVSVEALRPEGKENLDFMPYALSPNFAVAHLVYSWEQRAIIKSQEPETHYNFIPLNFRYQSSQVQNVRSTMTALFLSGVQKSVMLGRKNAYDMFTYNCTNKLFELIDESLNSNFDFEVLRSDVLKFSKNELPRLINYVEDLTKDKTSNIPSDVKVQLKNILQTEFIKNIKEHKATEKDLNFLSAFPPFVEGHLKARKLIDTK